MTIKIGNNSNKNYKKTKCKIIFQKAAVHLFKHKKQSNTKEEKNNIEKKIVDLGK